MGIDFGKETGEREMNNNSNRPIYIVSSPRSGSTLLRLLLNAHSTIAFPPPTFLWPFIYPFLYTYGDLANEKNLILLIEDILKLQKNKPWPVEINTEKVLSRLKKRGFLGVYSALMEFWCELHGKVRWGEKTPRNSFYIRDILEHLPEAQFIHIIRDGRDVAVDWIENLDWPKNIYCTALQWRDFVKAILAWRQKLTSDQYLEVYYEELVANPAETLQKICVFLKVEYEPEMMEYYCTQETEKWATSAFCHRHVSRPITTDFVGIYKNRLEVDDRRLLAAIIGKELKELGYSVEEEPRKIDPEEIKQYMEDGRGIEIPMIKFKIWHKERREERRRDGIWSDKCRSKIFG
jgi:hypothetical protein